jgi:hypothetical protein
MATGTVYLDVDDEITSAAARIRGSEATRVALVVPYGSRIATSRINFRLLSREAIVNNRRLSIVAADPATRALAASAGLPVFASVAEHEAAVEGEAAASAAAPETTGGLGAPAATAAPIPPPTPAEAPPDASDETLVIPGPPVSAAAAGAAAALPAAAAAIPSAASGSTAVPVTKSRRFPRVGTPAIVAAAVIALAVVIAGVGAYILLPSATIRVTPNPEAIPPIALVVRADPNVTAPDAEHNVVPAIRLTIPVEVTDTFTTIGRRTVETVATGTVTFVNKDFTASNTIPAGSVVSTQAGIRFTTDRSLTLDRAKLVGLQIIPTVGDVRVTAVRKGTAGNVGPNKITVIPPGEDPITLDVSNQPATTGGSHEQFPQVKQSEIDAAISALRVKLDDQFSQAVEAGADAPPDATVFSDTAVLADPTPTVDPATLVGQEVDTFELGLKASGTVIAVDDSPVSQIAETKLLANVGADHRLVEGSINIVPGNPTVKNGIVSFPVTAKASRVKILDPAALLASIKGLSVEAARSKLQPLGEVEISTWPDWVHAIPTMDSRVTLEIGGQGGSPTPGGSVGPGDSVSPGSSGSRSNPPPSSASGSGAPASGAP